ncbi:LADA_0F11650g1_1 [Lachancea dasiensis]|uniref:LADA_0F11650g1_1 n=1 Tax=Lachancea dasiensis TaxID=1072105 RepID=A0A1G4JMF6_9SACH|nr:LADA_0F11650g1_1 [Lachancea dasiensis]
MIRLLGWRLLVRQRLFKSEGHRLPLACRSYSLQVLRPYQLECIEKCVMAIQQGQMRIGVSIATGGGKTVIFSHLIDRLRGLCGGKHHRALVLVHRRELAQQACNVLGTFFPQLNVQVEMGSLNCDVPSSDVVVASVQTLIRRLDRYSPGDIDLIIIDEAHHAAAKSYLQVLKHFGADCKDSPIPVVGFSATFERADNKALSAVMDKIVFHRGILEMIDDKWLCEGRFTTVDVNIDLSDVSISGSDFQIDGLSQVVNTQEVNNIVLRTYQQKQQQHNLRSTLLFGCDVQHVATLQALFQNNGINAEFVTAKTRQLERDSIVEDFKAGRIQVLLNCGIFTEGTDLPNVDSILLCRPTRSRSLLVQMIGRGLRLHHSKDYCHIVDFVGASSVGVVSFPTLAGLDAGKIDLDEATMQDLAAIKEDLALKEQAAESEHNQRMKDEKLAHQKFQEILRNANAFDLSLTTFEDFISFHKQTAAYQNYDAPIWKSALAKEIKYINDSSFPWVRFAKDAWAMSLDNGHHLRIYKIFEKGQKRKDNDCIYTLKLYSELPYQIRDELGMKFRSRAVKASTDLAVVITAVEKLIEELISPPGPRTRNFSKFAPWRSTPASPKQKGLLKNKIKKVLFKEDSKWSDKLSASDVEKYVDGVTKGEASNILFATSLAPIFPLNSLCKIMAYRL